MARKLLTPGTTFTKTIEQGPNTGDRVTFKVGPSGKPYPIRVLSDKGGDSTLRDNSGVQFGKGKKKRTTLNDITSATK